MGDEGLCRVGEERTEDVNLVAGHIPRLARGDSERKADELAEVGLGGGVSLNCGGLGIERYPVRLHQFGEKLARLVLGLYEPVVVGNVGEGLRGV